MTTGESYPKPERKQVYKDPGDVPEAFKNEYAPLGEGAVPREAKDTYLAAERTAEQRRTEGRLTGLEAMEVMETEAVEHNKLRQNFINDTYKLGQLLKNAERREEDRKALNDNPFLVKDRGLMKQSIGAQPGLLEYAAPELQNDQDIVRTAVSQDGRTLRYASEQLRAEPEMVRMALETDSRALFAALGDASGDKNLVLQAIQKSPENFRAASAELHDDKDVVLAAVAGQGTLLGDASERLRDDEDVVLAAVSNNGYAYRFASRRLANDKDIALAAVHHGGADSVLYTMPTALQNDKDMALALVSDPKISLNDFFYLGDDVRKDRDVLLASARAGHWQRPPKELQDDTELAIEMVTKGGYNLPHMGFFSDRLKSDKEFVLAVIANNSLAVQDASPELKDDPDIVATVTKSNSRALEFVTRKQRVLLHLHWATNGALGVFGLDPYMDKIHPN